MSRRCLVLVPSISNSRFVTSSYPKALSSRKTKLFARIRNMLACQSSSFRTPPKNIASASTAKSSGNKRGNEPHHNFIVLKLGNIIKVCISPLGCLCQRSATSPLSLVLTPSLSYFVQSCNPASTVKNDATGSPNSSLLERWRLAGARYSPTFALVTLEWQPSWRNTLCTSPLWSWPPVGHAMQHMHSLQDMQDFAIFNLFCVCNFGANDVPCCALSG